MASSRPTGVRATSFGQDILNALDDADFKASSRCDLISRGVNVALNAISG
jgi:hypothetical protein